MYISSYNYLLSCTIYKIKNEHKNVRNVFLIVTQFTTNEFNSYVLFFNLISQTIKDVISYVFKLKYMC